MTEVDLAWGVMLGGIVLLFLAMVAVDVCCPPREVKRVHTIARAFQKQQEDRRRSINSVINPAIERRGYTPSAWDKLGGKV